MGKMFKKSMKNTQRKELTFIIKVGTSWESKNKKMKLSFNSTFLN